MRRVSRWCTHWLHPSHSHWLPPPRQLGEVAVGQEGHRRQSAASCPLSLQEALSALEELHQKSKHLHLRPLNLQPHSVVSESKKWHNWGFLSLSKHKELFLTMLRHVGGCTRLWSGALDRHHLLHHHWAALPGLFWASPAWGHAHNWFRGHRWVTRTALWLGP